MKKIFALLLLSVLLMSLSFSAFADGETIITTVVPPPEYVLSIPASLAIEYECTDFTLGSVSATAVSNVKPGDCLQVSVTWSDFISGETSTTIPLTLFVSDGRSEPAAISNGTFLPFTADESGIFTGAYSISAKISGEAWNRAKPGNYAATVAFVSAVM